MITASPQVDELIEMIPTPLTVAAFAELYERHSGAIFRAALRVTGNAADAEDVLQAVFLRVLSRSAEEVSSRPAAYFRRAAVNAAVDLLRRRAAHGETAYDVGAHDPTVEPALLLKEQLRRAVATLPGEDATLFLLRHVEGLSIDELAALFRLEKNNVSVRLHRIRLRLQAELSQ